MLRQCNCHSSGDIEHIRRSRYLQSTRRASFMSHQHKFNHSFKFIWNVDYYHIGIVMVVALRVTFFPNDVCRCLSISLLRSTCRYFAHHIISTKHVWHFTLFVTFVKSGRFISLWTESHTYSYEVTCRLVDWLEAKMITNGPASKTVLWSCSRLARSQARLAF